MFQKARPAKYYSTTQRRLGYGGSMGENLHHTTINLEHSYGAPVERVFSEFADPATRARWSAPTGDTLVYDTAEFREGGGDVFRCGPPNDLRFR
jgi:uncharacterized protein YndB with AHSA1/START domain